MSSASRTEGVRFADSPLQIVFLGPGSIGKTCALTRLVKGHFPVETVPTVIDDTLVMFESGDGDRSHSAAVIATMWADSMNREESWRLRPLNYCRADLLVCCVDVSQPTSMHALRDEYFPEIEQHRAHPDKQPGIRHVAHSAHCAILALKTDLRHNEAAISKLGDTMLSSAAIADFGREIGWPVIEMSALTGDGVATAAATLVKLAANKRASAPPKSFAARLVAKLRSWL
jgi:GTPase SAR1 family protein